MLKIISFAAAFILSTSAFATSYNCSFQLKGTAEDGEVIGTWQESNVSIDLSRESFSFVLWKKAIKNDKNEIVDYVLNPGIYNGNTKQWIDVEYPMGTKRLKISTSGPDNFSAVGECLLVEEVSKKLQCSSPGDYCSNPNDPYACCDWMNNICAPTYANNVYQCMPKAG